MSLRRRLLLTVVLAAVPLLLALAWARDEVLRRAAEDSMREMLVDRMEAGGRERCEQDPARARDAIFRSRGGGDGPRRPDRVPRRRRPVPVVHAYDTTFRSMDPAAPPVPADLRAELEGQELASRHDGGGLTVLARMPWDDGPCAILLAQRPDRDRPEPGPSLLASALVLCAGFLVAVWVAAGPVVRRIHALSADVRRSAGGRYAEPVRASGHDEIAQLAAAFNEAGEELRGHVTTVEQRERTLREFVANTTHDVMLPLSVLLGHLSRLQKTPERDPATVDAAIEEAQYMASLVHNLAAAAKLEAAATLEERHPLDLRDVVERVVARHRALAEARHVEIGFAVPEDPVRVVGDVTLVEQAVGNLVGNAIRHNRAGGHAAVVLEESGPSRFILRVEDDGPGVPEEARAHLGERRFRTEEARQRHPEGRGLGLSIVRDVALRHGFTVRFGSGDPSGLVVELEGPTA